MAKRKTAIDKTIEALEAEIRVIRLAIEKLRTQQAMKPERRRRRAAVDTPRFDAAAFEAAAQRD